jgi:hypothetical protein
MYKSSSDKTARAQGEGIQGRLRMHKVPMRGRVNSMKEHQSVGYAVSTERLKCPTTRKVCSGEHRQDLMMSTWSGLGGMQCFCASTLKGRTRETSIKGVDSHVIATVGRARFAARSDGERSGGGESVAGNDKSTAK